MKIRLRHHDTIFEYERGPLPEGRFRVLCGLAAGAVYAGMVLAVAALCGGYGLLLVLIGTVAVALVAAAP